LRQKVLEKNPDEFYFAMVNKKGPSTMGKNRTGTVNGDRGSQVLSQDAVRLFKTQDLGYVRTMRNKTAKEVETLKKQVVGIKGKGKRIVYVDDEDEQLQKAQDDEDDEEENEENVSQEDFEAKRLRKLKERESEKIEARLELAEQRLKALIEAEEALDLQRAKMAKSPTIGGVTKQGVKFKVRERKR
jgi:U3 small nucleolar RNA-associated protein 11